MTNRHILRLTAAAAATALAGFSAHAIEATQWNPQETEAPMATASTDAMLAPTAWTVGRGEATQFHDAVARDTMTARATVREELRQSRTRRLVNDTGEAGATEAVLARREEFNARERDRLLALNEPSAGDDPIAALAAARIDSDDASMYALTAGTDAPLLPSNQTVDATLASSTLPPLPGEPRVDETMIAERPMDDSMTVAVR